MANVHFHCLKKWIDTKIRDASKRTKLIDMDLMKCDICKTKLANKH